MDRHAESTPLRDVVIDRLCALCAERAPSTWPGPYVAAVGGLVEAARILRYHDVAYDRTQVADDHAASTTMATSIGDAVLKCRPSGAAPWQRWSAEVVVPADYGTTGYHIGLDYRSQREAVRAAGLALRIGLAAELIEGACPPGQLTAAAPFPTRNFAKALAKVDPLRARLRHCVQYDTGTHAVLDLSLDEPDGPIAATIGPLEPPAGAPGTRAGPTRSLLRVLNTRYQQICDNAAAGLCAPLTDAPYEFDVPWHDADPALHDYNRWGERVVAWQPPSQRAQHCNIGAVSHPPTDAEITASRILLERIGGAARLKAAAAHATDVEPYLLEHLEAIDPPSPDCGLSI